MIYRAINGLVHSDHLSINCHHSQCISPYSFTNPVSLQIILPSTLLYAFVKFNVFFLPELPLMPSYWNSSSWDIQLQYLSIGSSFSLSYSWKIPSSCVVLLLCILLSKQMLTIFYWLLTLLLFKHPIKISYLKVTLGNLIKSTLNNLLALNYIL